MTRNKRGERSGEREGGVREREKDEESMRIGKERKNRCAKIIFLQFM